MMCAMVEPSTAPLNSARGIVDKLTSLLFAAISLQSKLPSGSSDLACAAATAISLLASTDMMSSTLLDTASGWMKLRGNLMVLILCISSRLLVQTSRNFSGIGSSQPSFKLTISDRFILNLAVIGVVSPMGSNTSAALPVKVRRSKFWRRACCTSPTTGPGVLPRFIFPKNNGLMAIPTLSSTGHQVYPSRPMLDPSAETLSLGGDPTKVKSLTFMEAWARVNITLSANLLLSSSVSVGWATSST